MKGQAGANEVCTANTVGRPGTTNETKKGEKIFLFPCLFLKLSVYL